MTVFILRAEADAALAAPLARAAERRGEFVDEEDGFTTGRPFQAIDRVILLWTGAAAEPQARDGFERRAVEAWALERLTILRLDPEAPPPLALRDQPMLGLAEFEDLDALLSQVLGLAPAAPSKAEKAKRARPLWRPIPELLVLIASIGSAAVAALAAFELAPVAWFGPAFAAALAGAIASVLLGLRRRAQAKEAQAKSARRKAAPAAAATAPPPAAAPPAAEVLFAPSPDDAALVEEWLAEAGRLCGGVAIASDEAAGPALAHAVQSARVVAIGASPPGFAAPHVRRAAHLAARSGRPLVLAHLRPAPTPPEFAAALARARDVELYRLDPAERARAVAVAVASV